jgi:8-amino-7-oxononanoate synthase
MDGSRRSTPSTPLDRRLARELAKLRAADLYRTRRIIEGTHGAQIVVDGRRCVNFCSNDYLGLASDPRVAAAAQKALAQSGTGSGAAALISGYNIEHARLEEELAAFVARPRVLLFSSGWAANVGTLRALVDRQDAILADELNHASLIDGARLSGAEYVRVRHADASSYEAALGEPGVAASKDKIIVSDSVFSMDGDVAPLSSMTALAKAREAMIMIDDAHGFGVAGEGGRGAAVHDVDVYVATLGKALGGSGAFVAGSESLIEYLIQRARSWVFSTAPAPAMAAAARAALQIVQSEPHLRAQLIGNIERFRVGASQLGIGLLPQSLLTPIQPILLHDDARALRVSRALFERGWWVAAIRPPTVPRGTARLRITLSAAHEPAQIDGLLADLDRALKAA